MSQTTMRRQLHPGQTRAWQSDARFVFVIAGTGGGKTWMGPLWLYREIQRNPKGNYLVIAPTYGQLQRVALPETRRFFDELQLGEYRAADRVYKLVSGGGVYFGSADNPLTLEGVHCNAIWLDEAGQMRSEVWDVALRRTGFHSGRILGTTTPYDLGWLKQRVYDLWTGGDPNYAVVQFGSIENPAYPREEFERARATLPSWKFKMFYQGVFARPEGLIYQDFDSGRHIIDPFEIPSAWRRIAGADFGFNNPTAALWAAIDPDGVVYLYREYKERGKLPSESAEDLMSFKDDGWLESIQCDPSSPEAIEQYRRSGLPAQAADNAVMEGIERVIALIKTDRLRVFRGLVHTLDEIESYRWLRRNVRQAGEVGVLITDAPAKENDHLMDALRYLAGAIDTQALSAEIRSLFMTGRMHYDY